MKIERMLTSSSVVCHDASVMLGKLVQTNRSVKVYLLKDGSVSSSPVYGQEIGVFVTPSLVLSLRVSKNKMTAAQAKLFYKLEKCAVPTMFQVLLLQLNMRTVSGHLFGVGMGNTIEPFPLDSVWYEEVLNASDANEKRQVISFIPQDDYQELSCDCLQVKPIDRQRVTRRFLIDSKFAIVQCLQEYSPEYFLLLGTWNDFDLLTTSSENMPPQWLFFRNRKTNEITHYIVTNTYEDLEIISDELYVYDYNVYQAVDGKIVKIHMLGHYDSASFSDGKLHLTRDEAYCRDMPSEFATYEYVKGADGLFTQCDN